MKPCLSLVDHIARRFERRDAPCDDLAQRRMNCTKDFGWVPIASELGMDRNEVVERLVAGSSYSRIAAVVIITTTPVLSPIRWATWTPALSRLENREALRPL